MSLVAIYVESSAVLAWIFGEAAGEHTRTIINAARPILSSTLTIIEVERAVRRALNTGALVEADAAALQGLFRSVARGWELMEMTPEVQRRAADAFPVEPVRSLDALHLATVLAFCELYGSVAVLSYDSRIRDNLAAMGVPLAR